jgi:hypothetical protein
MPAPAPAAITAPAQEMFGQHPISVFEVIIDAFRQRVRFGRLLRLLHVFYVETVEGFESPFEHAQHPPHAQQTWRPNCYKKKPAAGEPGPASMFFRLWMTACLLAALQRIGFRIKVSGMDERAD